MQMIGAILTGLVVTVLGTVLAIRLDRWLLRGKVKEGKLLGEISNMQDSVDELLEALGMGAKQYSKKDRLERMWKTLEKMISQEEKVVLCAAFQNAASSLGNSIPDAKRALSLFQTELGNLARKLGSE